jgi:hypothetical protein
MLTKLVVNCTTGEEIEVELSAEEIAQREADIAAYEREMTEKQTLAEAKAAAKASAEAKLAALGLTTEEIAAL